MNAIFHRVSIRQFKEDAINEQQIESIMRAAMAAPSAMNQQPWEFYVVENKEMIQKLAACGENTACAAGAPLVIVPCYKKEDILAPGLEMVDMSAATENLLLEVDTLGLGAVWLGIAPREEAMNYVRDALQIEARLIPFAMIAVGYPAEEKQQEDRFDPKRIHFVK